MDPIEIENLHKKIGKILDGLIPVLQETVEPSGLDFIFILLPPEGGIGGITSNLGGNALLDRLNGAVDIVKRATDMCARPSPSPSVN